MKPHILLAALAIVGLVSCGQNGEFKPDANISVTVREDGSGTKGAFLEIVGLKGKADPVGAVVANGTTAVLTEVASNPYAIAYDSLGYVDSSVKILSVGGVAPGAETILDGSYAISRPLNVIYQTETVNSSALYADYLTFLQSKTAQDLTQENGYVNAVVDAKEYVVSEAYNGTIKISGSTSLQPLMIKIANAYMEVQKGVSVQVSGGGSGTGYSDGENGVSVFGMISEEFNSSKAPSCTYQTVAKDGIAVVVNPKNPLNEISKAALTNIYNPEKGEDAITKWSDLLR
ncbi:MAG: substrate-binding domain-containing protein [Candidatus Enteromonas sp.]|nr:substrate-binding domain-containing protein [Candidatus Enteromonas sp.]